MRSTSARYHDLPSEVAMSESESTPTQLRDGHAMNVPSASASPRTSSVRLSAGSKGRPLLRRATRYMGSPITGSCERQRGCLSCCLVSQEISRRSSNARCPSQDEAVITSRYLVQMFGGGPLTLRAVASAKTSCYRDLHEAPLRVPARIDRSQRLHEQALGLHRRQWRGGTTPVSIEW